MRDQLAALRETVDNALERFVASAEVTPPALDEAVRYAIMGRGKRLRPTLLLASGEAVGGRREDLLPAACAMEMIHAFSLVHDDLPALDNDDLRRGRPTVHVKFGEAMAILAGDALLNLAFEILSRYPEGDAFAPRKIAAIRAISSAVGLTGMIGGQAMDMEFETKKATGAQLETLHRLKTGALITASCLAGGILSGADNASLDRLERYGRALGLAFQITDDILDVEGTASEIGKSPGKDARARKATFPSVWGLEASRRMAVEHAEEAVAAVEPLGKAAVVLVEIARSVATRRN